MSSHSPKTQPPAGEKLQKVLSRAGLGSRRACEALIKQGQVIVNGKIAELGLRVTESDKIKYKGQLLKESRLQKSATRVILYNKPEGLVCSRKDEQDRDTIYSQLPKIFQGRWISIGRLDLNTSGLLVLTNNGDLANRMMHPSYEMEREYTVRVFGEVTDDMLKTLHKGVQLEDGAAKFHRIIPMPTEEGVMNRWFKVVIKEGRKREVRRIWESQGVQVSRLHRIRYGQLSLPRGLRTGKTEELTWKQINELLRSVDLPEESQPDKRPSKGLNKSSLHKRDAKKSDRTFAGKFGKHKTIGKTRLGTKPSSRKSK